MRLLYFPLRARGEALRMLFRYSDITVAEEIIPFSAWPELKPTFSNQQLPQLCLDDGKLLPETADIALHVAKLADSVYHYRHNEELGLVPSSPEQKAAADFCWRENRNSTNTT